VRAFVPQINRNQPGDSVKLAYAGDSNSPMVTQNETNDGPKASFVGSPAVGIEVEERPKW
jgi:hypothetical protein